MARYGTPLQPPAFVTPMAAQVVQRLPEGNDWMYEVKFDGYRALLLKNGISVQIRSRNNKDLTRMYPGVRAAGLVASFFSVRCIRYGTRSVRDGRV